MEEDRIGEFCNSLTSIGFDEKKWNNLTVLEKYFFLKESCLLLSSKKLTGDRISAFKIYLYCLKNRFLPDGFYDPDIYRRKVEESSGKSLLDSIKDNDYITFTRLINLMNAEILSFNKDEAFHYAITLKREQMARDIKAIIIRSVPQKAEAEERKEVLMSIDPNLVYDPLVLVFFVHHPFTLSKNTTKLPNVPLIRGGEKMGDRLKELGGVWNSYYKGWMFIKDIPHYMPSPIRLRGDIPKEIAPIPPKGIAPVPPKEIAPIPPKGIAPVPPKEIAPIPPKGMYPVVPKPPSLQPAPLNLGAPVPVPSKPVSELGTPIPPSAGKPMERKSLEHVKPVIPAPPPTGQKDPLDDSDPIDNLIKKLSEDKRSGGKKRSKSSEKYDKEYQRCDTPDEDSPTRIFYETLYEEKPNSALAICWLVHRGVYEDNEEGQRLLDKYRDLDNTGETVTVNCRAV